MHRTLHITGVTVSILLGFLLCPSSSSIGESSDTITFSTTISAYPEEVEIQLNLNVGIDPTISSEMSPRQSTDGSVLCYSQMAEATIEWIGTPFMPQEADFVTPLGNSDRIYLGAFSIAEMKYFVEFAEASVLTDINLQGNGSASPSSLKWSSFGTKSFTVSHTGSTSSKELLFIQWIDWKYIGNLTVFTTDILNGIIIDRSEQRVEIDSSQYFSTVIGVDPSQGFDPLMVVLIVVIASGVALIAIFARMYLRKGKSHNQVARAYLTGLRVLVVFACFIFTVSVFCPFFQTKVALPQHRPAYYWSFMETKVYARATNGWYSPQAYVFEWYWDSMETWGITSGASWIHHALILMLGAQVFTVLFGVLASINRSNAYRRESWTSNPYLLLASTALNVVVVSCMWFVYSAFGPLYVKQFEAGFWLSLLSLTLFIVAFPLSWKQPRMQ